MNPAGIESGLPDPIRHSLQPTPVSSPAVGFLVSPKQKGTSMRMIRSLIYAGLALAAMAFTISAPAVAAAPTDPGIYEAVKASIDAPAILQVHDAAVALTCESPFAVMSAAGRSSLPTDARMNLTDPTGARMNFIEVRSRC